MLELACVLRDRVNCAELEEVTATSGITLVHNVAASARRQLEERGGLSLAFVPDHEIGQARTDPTQRNDAELSRQAKAVLDDHGALTVVDGQLALGHSLVRGYAELPGKIREVGAAAAQLLGLDEAPLASGLLLFGHGIRDGLRLNPDGYRAQGSLTISSCEDFVAQLDPCLGREVIVSLFACNNGRGVRAGGNGGTNDPSYGHALAGEVPGANSLGWTLQRALAHTDRLVTVWAHTTTGHTTRNPRLRVFSSWGDADLVSLLLGARYVEPASVRHYVSRFAYRFESQTRALALQTLNQGNLLRALGTLSARYLPWAPLSGRDPDPAEAGWSESAHGACLELFERIRALLRVTSVRAEAWAYEGARRQALVGRNPESSSDEALAPHFDYEEFARAEHGSPLRLELQLVQALEILRERSRCAFKLEALFEGGAMARCKVAPRRLERVREAAEEMVSAGHLSGAWELEGQLYVSTGALDYDAELRWIKGSRREGALVSRTIRWEQVRAAGQLRRTLGLAAQDLLDRGGALIGVGEGGLSLRIQGDAPALEAAASRALRAGWIDSLQREDEGVILTCAPDSESTSSQG